MNLSKILITIFSPFIVGIIEVLKSISLPLYFNENLPSWGFLFSTLHSNDSLGCINRLVNLGIDSYLLSLVLQMVVSQRLVRKLCPHCKKEDENYKEKLKSLNLSEEKYKNIKFYTSAGCDKCMGTGYIGRIPVFEIIYFDDILKDMLAQKKEIKQNFKTLLDDAMDKVKEGLTSLDEIMRQL